jgi:hypothetical protein
MSRAGTKSNQGDDYQRLVAVHWLIRLINDVDGISYIQAESNGLPDIDEEISVDDVVVVYANGRRRHIQAKKNQPQNRMWSLSDRSLADELPKIRNQLESIGDTIVELASRTPFGNLQSLAEASREYPDLNAFRRGSGKTLKDTLTALATKWERSEEHSFYLLRRLEFASCLSYEDLNRQNRQDLARIVSHADIALPILESFLNVHQSKLQSVALTIYRDDVIHLLEQRGVLKALMKNESEILEQFRQASCIGRTWPRTVGGRRIERVELKQLIQIIEDGADTVLVTDRPGSGKTCLLLDLADRIEQDPRYGLLFIKGDRFAKHRNEDELQSAGLPEDIAGLCGRLAEYRRVVVIIDSLDVLSMNREHGTLGMFLRLIDRLNPIPNVTVVAACRSFDLQYDPLLRDREWKHKVPVADFNYEEVVASLLKEWNVPEEKIDTDLRQLLALPQNLKLFEAIAARGGRFNIRTAYELQEVYLQEVVVKDPDLGTAAMEALQCLADRLLRERTQLISPASFSCKEAIRRTLVSRGVLFEDANGGLGFSHQTLFDNLAVSSSLRRDEDLVGFIKSHPPFPFLRAAVRTFVFHLRTHAPDLFHRQISAAIHDTGIAYHFRRLIAESLAEIVPHDDDWPLLRRLFLQETELFRRLFWRLQGDGWWRLLLDHWLPSLSPPISEKEWYGLFVSQLDRWMNNHPAEVVSLWRRAFSEDWGNKNELAMRITFQLHKFQHWDTEDVKELIETLVSENKTERDFLGKVLSLYTAATNQGDDLLWQYIVKDVGSEDIGRFNIGGKLHCDPHVFHNKEFLNDRLSQSDLLLDIAIDTLEEWATKDGVDSSLHRFRSTFLYNSSWEYRHSDYDMHPADDLTVLLSGIEHAIVHHAHTNDAWWKRREPQLRSVREEALLYFLVQAYKGNHEANVDGMAQLLTDAQLLRYGHIEHELGEMIQAGYHLLPPDVQEKNQNAILRLYAEEHDAEEEGVSWVHRIIYNYLIWIPTIFLLPRSQAFIERFQAIFGTALPEPDLHSWGGMVGYPVPLEIFIKLNDADLCRLLGYYKDSNDHSSHPADFNKGGRDMVGRVLSEAAAVDPMRYLAVFPLLEFREFWPGYAVSVLEGVASHVRYRFARLQPPQGWQPVEPLPDGQSLARSLLNLIESRPNLWNDGHAVARLLEACCEVLNDHDSAERLTFQLFRLLHHPDPKEERQRIFSQNKQGITAQDLMTDAINSVRGIAAGSAISLYNQLLEKEIDPPELLFPLLRHYARDHVAAVRAAILYHLPFLTSKRHALGWQLFNDLFREPQTHLWPLAEKHLYHQYHEHFDEVAPCLDRMLEEAPDETGNAWGRIATLAVLSGHITEDDLFQRLESMNLNEAWLGASQVFTANLDQHLHDNLCVNGLQRILGEQNLSQGVYKSIEHAFDPKHHGRHLGAELAVSLIDRIAPDDQHFDLHIVLDWIADLAGKDPVGALGICERLVERLSMLTTPYRIWHTEPLIAALSNILREADETDNPDLIKRAVRLQDQFLQMDIPGMDDYFKQAGQL